MEDTASNLTSTNDLTTILEKYENDLKNHINEVKNLQRKIKIIDDKIEDLQYVLNNVNDTNDMLEDKVAELQKLFDYFKNFRNKFIEFLKDKFFSTNKYDNFINDLYEKIYLIITILI